MTVHDRLFEIRKKTKLTQGDFSKRLGISRRAYINYERGDRELPSAFLIKLHAELSINPSWLLTGEGTKTNIEKGDAIKAAVILVQTYALVNGLKIDPEKSAKLVLLLVEYFEEIGGINKEFANKILEAQV